MDWLESEEAIGMWTSCWRALGLGHGRRQTLGGTWEAGERKGRTKGSAVNERRARKAEAIRAPGWDKYAWLRHGFSTRVGGVSSIYGEGTMNLGFTKEDETVNVAENRRRFLGEVTGSPTSQKRDLGRPLSC